MAPNSNATNSTNSSAGNATANATNATTPADAVNVTHNFYVCMVYGYVVNLVLGIAFICTGTPVICFMPRQGGDSPFNAFLGCNMACGAMLVSLTATAAAPLFYMIPIYRWTMPGK